MRLTKCRTDNFGQEPFTYDVNQFWGGELKKVWQKSKNKKNGEKIWLGGGGGGGVKLLEN